MRKKVIVRIIAGECKGRSIEAPTGKGTRPTTDRMRESLMSRIGSISGGFEGLRVLDGFAGSGALGLEALSRGAESCLFCERDRRALGCLRSNIERLGMARRATVVSGDVLKTCGLGRRGPFDLVFLDPPYALATEAVAAWLERLCDEGAFAPFGIISWESSREQAASCAEALAALGWIVLSSKALASSAVTLARTRSQAE